MAALKTGQESIERTAKQENETYLPVWYVRSGFMFFFLLGLSFIAIWGVKVANGRAKLVEDENRDDVPDKIENHPLNIRMQPVLGKV